MALRVQQSWFETNERLAKTERQSAELPESDTPESRMILTPVHPLFKVGQNCQNRLTSHPVICVLWRVQEASLASLGSQEAMYWLGQLKCLDKGFASLQHPSLRFPSLLFLPCQVSVSVWFLNAPCLRFSNPPYST